MRFTPFLILLLFFSMEMKAQSLSPIKVCDLPAELNETSGLVKIGPNKFVTHNDSGSEPKLYVFDSSGVIQRRIKISNASNIDWEDLTVDSKGNLYVGDFGNNANDRKNLKIYMIASPNTFTKDSTVAAITQFTYSDQKAFPPAAPHQNFDMEAFFWYNDSLYLFSKDRSNPYSGYTKCYRLPAKNGTFTAQLIDSFYTGSGGFLTYSITGAAVYPTGNKVMLLGYDKCWTFSSFSGNKFFKGVAKTYAFAGLSQKEALFFENSNRVWFTQENSPLATVGLFRFDLPISTPSGEKELIKKLYKVYPVPADDVLKVEVSDEIAEPDMLLEILHINGSLVLNATIQPQETNEIAIKSLTAGKYLLRVNGLSAGEFIKK